MTIGFSGSFVSRRGGTGSGATFRARAGPACPSRASLYSAALRLLLSPR